MPDTSAFTNAIEEFIDRCTLAEARAIDQCQSQTTLCGVRSRRTFSDKGFTADVECDFSVPYGEVVYEDLQA